MSFTYPPREYDSAAIGQIDVHQHEIGSEFARQPKSRRAVTAGTDYFGFSVFSQQQTQPLAHYLVIIDNENTGGHGRKVDGL